MNELVTKDRLTEEEQNLLAPYLIEASVGENGSQELVFEFPEPSPLKIDLTQIRKRFKEWGIEQIMSEPDPFDREMMPKVIAHRITISNY